MLQAELLWFLCSLKSDASGKSMCVDLMGWVGRVNSVTFPITSVRSLSLPVGALGGEDDQLGTSFLV